MTQFQKCYTKIVKEIRKKLSFKKSLFTCLQILPYLDEVNNECYLSSWLWMATPLKSAIGPCKSHHGKIVIAHFPSQADVPV